MGEGGIDPAVAYAADLLGYVVTDDNRDLFTDEELQAWDHAIAEWHQIHDC